MANILLVEDDASIQNMYRFALTQSGFNVTVAGTGGEALARVEEQHFDIVFLDMLMTGMSGLDFLKTYDFKTNSPATKIVALTNVTNDNIEERAIAMGVVGYLTKADYEPTKLADYATHLLGSEKTA